MTLMLMTWEFDALFLVDLRFGTCFIDYILQPERAKGGSVQGSARPRALETRDLNVHDSRRFFFVCVPSFSRL